MINNTVNEFLLNNHDSNFSAKHQIAEIKQIQERSKMFALDHCGVNSRTIAWFMNRHVTTVRRWILRSINGGELCDQKRSGRPPVYNEKIQLKTIAF